MICDVNLYPNILNFTPSPHIISRYYTGNPFLTDHVCMDEVGTMYILTVVWDEVNVGIVT